MKTRFRGQISIGNSSGVARDKAKKEWKDMNRKNKAWKWICCLLLAVAQMSGGRMTGAADGKERNMMQERPATAAFAAYGDEELNTVAASVSLGVDETVSVFEISEAEGLTVIPGGMPFGVKFMTEGVTVVGFCDVEADGKKVNPATDAGLKLRDVILRVNGEPLLSAAGLTEKIESCGGKELTLHCRRGKEEVEIRLKPVYSKAESRYKTGIWVRDSGAGIGTVTFILPDTGAFAGLGHGICDSDTGELISMRRGTVSDVTISSVVKGAAGAPGELKGYFNPGKVGALLGNTSCGVWGVFSEIPESDAEPIKLGLRGDLREGEAYILSTLDSNKTQRYDVEISNINRDANGSKCFTVKITDPDLLAVSGGIVQGMSGSPIIQDGKLVGAVTHVLINDPTSGYGIFAENMLVNMPVPAR